MLTTSMDPYPFHLPDTLYIHIIPTCSSYLSCLLLGPLPICCIIFIKHFIKVSGSDLQTHTDILHLSPMTLTLQT